MKKFIGFSMLFFIVFFSSAALMAEEQKSAEQENIKVLQTAGEKPAWLAKGVSIEEQDGKKMVLFACYGRHELKENARDTAAYSCSGFFINYYQRLIESEVVKIWDELKLKKDKNSGYQNVLSIVSNNIDVRGMIEMEYYWQKVENSATRKTYFECFVRKGMEYGNYLSMIEEIKKKTSVLLSKKGLNKNQLKQFEKKLDELAKSGETLLVHNKTLGLKDK